MSRYSTEQFCVKPPDEFICSICQDVFDKPRETPCRHVFCLECISSVQTRDPKCPLCRRPFIQRELKSVLPVFKSMINQLEMKCKFEECQKVIPLERYLTHVDSCECKEVNCPYEKCTIKCQKKSLNKHKKRCEFRTIDCPRGCGATIMFKDTNHHIDSECTKGKKNCPHCKKSDYLTDDPHDCIEYLLSMINDNNKNCHENYQHLRQAMQQKLKLTRQGDQHPEEEINSGLNITGQKNQSSQEEIIQELTVIKQSNKRLQQEMRVMEMELNLTRQNNQSLQLAREKELDLIRQKNNELMKEMKKEREDMLNELHYFRQTCQINYVFLRHPDGHLHRVPILNPPADNFKAFKMWIVIAVIGIGLLVLCQGDQFFIKQEA